MHELAFPLLVGLIAIALAFDFLNGLHDAANSIATVVATRLLSPAKAVAFAAFFNFAAYFLSLAVPQLHRVADTIILEGQFNVGSPTMPELASSTVAATPFIAPCMKKKDPKLF